MPRLRHVHPLRRVRAMHEERIPRALGGLLGMHLLLRMRRPPRARLLHLERTVRSRDVLSHDARARSRAPARRRLGSGLMRAVVQRVHFAKVIVEGEVVGSIQRGLLVYLGVGKGDTPAERTFLIDKILGLRIFSNEAGKFDRSVLDVGGSLLVVSQFTLYADVSRGRRPGFDAAMPPAEAEAEYEAFVAAAREKITVATGRFRAHMRVESANDGPVTIWIDTAKAGAPTVSAS